MMKRFSRVWPSRVWAAPAILLGMGVVAPACLSRPIDTIEPRTTANFTIEVDNNKVDKIDILLAIDDSGSMKDKQTILAEAVPRLVESLVNPACVADDAESGLAPVTPETPTDDCPAEMHREFDPILDIHIGIVSSSVGFASIQVQVQSGVSPQSCNATGGNPDRRAHLVADVLEGEEEVETYEDSGFLAWDPEQKLSPPGENDLAKLTDNLRRMVRGVGQDGCGFEASLESWYRFLVEPTPPAQTKLEDGRFVSTGKDNDLLTQRDAFLRPDSLVAIVMLSDENDCSLRPDADYQMTSDGALDIIGYGKYSNLFCHDQEQLLQPVARYIDGLTRAQITTSSGQVVDNPLFVSKDGQVRSKDRVFLASIVGVPSQLVARDGDVANGLMNVEELEAAGAWTKLLGDTRGEGRDTHLLESAAQRDGLSHSAGDWDPIHGYEHDQGQRDQGELQYSCIFDLPEGDERVCSTEGCDCKTDNNPLCDGSGAERVQERAKAYPGNRQLQVMRGIGDQAIVGSICAKQVDRPEEADYGYKASIEALVERLKGKLRPPCLVRSVRPRTDGQVSCVVLEGRKTAPGETCSCDGVARSAVTPEHAAAEQSAREQALDTEADLDCYCEIDQLAGEGLTACQEQEEEDVALASGEEVSGWCYVDATSFPPVGNEALVAQCAPNQERIIRTVGDGQLVPGARMFVTCQSEN
jgi:hypothetical protein